MPFITKNGKPVWITPQRDRGFGKNKFYDTVLRVQIPDYILYGKDKHIVPPPHVANKWDNMQQYRDFQKDEFQREIQMEEKERLKENLRNNTNDINRLTDSIYLLKRPSLIKSKKESLARAWEREKKIEKLLGNYR